MLLFISEQILFHYLPMMLCTYAGFTAVQKSTNSCSALRCRSFVLCCTIKRDPDVKSTTLSFLNKRCQFAAENKRIIVAGEKRGKRVALLKGINFYPE